MLWYFQKKVFSYFDCIVGSDSTNLFLRVHFIHLHYFIRLWCNWIFLSWFLQQNKILLIYLCKLWIYILVYFMFTYKCIAKVPALSRKSLILVWTIGPNYLLFIYNKIVQTKPNCTAKFPGLSRKSLILVWTIGPNYLLFTWMSHKTLPTK